MMLLDRATLKNRFTGMQNAPCLKPKAKDHPCAFRDAFETACDEDQFNAELAQIMVSIAALTSTMPSTRALSDERVQRMLLSLEGYASPYLKIRFKKEATPAPDGKNAKNDIRVQQPRASRFRHMSRRPAEQAAAAMTTRFLRVTHEKIIAVMPLVPAGMEVFAPSMLRVPGFQVNAPRP